MHDVAISNNAALVAAITADRSLAPRDLTDGASPSLFALESSPRCLAVSDRSMICVGTATGQLLLFSDQGQPQESLKAHSKRIAQLEIFPDGLRVASSDISGRAIFESLAGDLSYDNQVAERPLSLRRVTSSQLAIARLSGAIVRIDLRNRDLSEVIAHSDGVTAFSREGSYLLSDGRDGTLSWRGASHTAIRNFPLSSLGITCLDTANGHVVFEAGDRMIYFCDFSKAGKLLAPLSNQQRLQLLDSETANSEAGRSSAELSALTVSHPILRMLYALQNEPKR